MSKRTYRQGDLDALCGLYSIVNGVGNVLPAPPSRSVSKAIFDILFNVIPPNDRVWVVANGLEPDELISITRRASRRLKADLGIAVGIRQPFHRATFATSVDFFEKVRPLTASDGTFAILNIKVHGCEHWTVLARIGRHTLRLRDSLGRTAFPIDRASITSGPYLIYPRNTLIVTARALDDPTPPASPQG